MGKAKRLGIFGAVIAVMALVVGRSARHRIIESRGCGDLIRQAMNNPRDCRVHRSLMQTSTSALRASALVTKVVFSGNLLRNGEQVGRIGVVTVCVHGQRGQGRGPVPHNLNPPRWTDHNPRHDRQQVAELHAADHRWLGSVSGRRRTSGLSRRVDQPQVELTFQLFDS